MERLKNSLMALASPALVQDSLFPDFVDKGDELVREYEEALDEDNIESQLNDGQKIAFQGLETCLETYSGEDFEAMYCDTLSLYSDKRWEEIRQLAKAFIASMGWPLEKPKKTATAFDDASRFTDD